MDPITFPLNADLGGRDVADLQAALLARLDTGAITRDDEGRRQESSANWVGEHSALPAMMERCVTS